MLTTAEIKLLIDNDATSEKKRFAAVGQRYYEGEHDILKNRLFYFNTDGNLVEDTARSNIKICHPFFTELSDQLTAHLLSFIENPIRARENVDGLQEHLDNYFDEDFWSEIGDLISGAYNKGFEYIYGYKGKENKLKFQCADSMGVVEVRANDTDDGCEYIIYWYIDRIDKGRKKIKRIQVWSETETYYYVQVDSGEIQLDKTAENNPRPHVIYTDEKTGQKMGYPLGYIPFWRLDNNKKQFSGLKPIKGLIDDYDLMQCGLSNNLVDFDTPLHVVSGFQGDDLTELQQNLKTKKIVGVDAEGGVSVQTVDIPYQARQAKAKDDENNIYKFGMGLNTYGLKDTAQTTNALIAAAYELLNIKTNNLERRLKPVLKDIVKVVLAEINAENGTDYQLKDVTIFKDVERSTMTNKTENIANEKVVAEIQQIRINTILNVAVSIGDEKALKLICEQLDLDFEEVKSQIDAMKEDQPLSDAKAALEGALINNEPPEE